MECPGTDFGVLEFESIAPDRQLSFVVPVFVKNNTFENKLNAWREWNWQGPEPLNMRFMRFTSIIQLNKVYNITYSGTNPYDLLHRIALRTPAGEGSKYVIVQYKYAVALSI